MPARDDPMDRARIRGEDQTRRFVRELRDARIGRGLSQRQVAAAVGIPRSTMSRIETGVAVDVSVRTACMLGAAVGMDVSLGTYPGSTRLRDEAQLRLLRRLATRLGEAWRWRYEVELPIHLDQRAWDAEAIHSETRVRITIDAETRIYDAQALLRRTALKRRDGNIERLILLVADTRTNRDCLEVADELFRAAFPCVARRALPSLILGRDPGEDALIVL